ncbi:hypothetical protein CT047_RS23460, partial [Vibrio parahaemolyticus]|nr:hypothetical protein [Vibrio parahaemolyticus]
MANIVIILSYILFVFFVYKLLKSNNLLVLLPVYYLFTVTYVLTGVFYLDYAKDTPFNMYELVSEKAILKSSYYYILASLLFYLGCSLFKQNKIETFLSRSRQLDIPYQKLIVFICFLTFIIFVSSYGFEPLLHREGYISQYHDRNKIGLIVFYIIAPISFVLIPFLRRRITKYIVYTILFMMLMSSSSRFLVMLPFLYIVGSYLRYGYFKLFTSLFHLMIVVFGLIFVLQIRYYTYQGLIPNINSFFSKGIDPDYLFTGLNYAFSFSLMGTAYVIENIPFDFNGFLIGINPMPSRYLNISYMLQVQEMLPTAPISAISLLSQSGVVLTSLFYFLSAYIFSFIFSRMKGETPLYYVVAGLFIIFMLFSIQ